MDDSAGQVGSSLEPEVGCSSAGSNQRPEARRVAGSWLSLVVRSGGEISVAPRLCSAGRAVVVRFPLGRNSLGLLFGRLTLGGRQPAAMGGRGWAQGRGQNVGPAGG